MLHTLLQKFWLLRPPTTLEIINNLPWGLLWILSGIPHSSCYITSISNAFWLLSSSQFEHTSIMISQGETCYILFQFKKKYQNQACFADL